MGKPKESLPFGEVTLLGHVCATLHHCTDPVVVIARDGEQVLPPLPANTQVTVDLSPKQGRCGQSALDCASCAAMGCLAPRMRCL